MHHIESMHHLGSIHHDESMHLDRRTNWWMLISSDGVEGGDELNYIKDVYSYYRRE